MALSMAQVHAQERKEYAERLVSEATIKVANETKRQTKSEDLMMILEERYGVVLPEYRKRINAADIETLDKWFLTAINAKNVEEVFN